MSHLPYKDSFVDQLQKKKKVEEKKNRVEAFKYFCFG